MWKCENKEKERVSQFSVCLSHILVAWDIVSYSSLPPQYSQLAQLSSAENPFIFSFIPYPLFTVFYRNRKNLEKFINPCYGRKDSFMEVLLLKLKRKYSSHFSHLNLEALFLLVQQSCCCCGRSNNTQNIFKDY